MLSNLISAASNNLQLPQLGPVAPPPGPFCTLIAAFQCLSIATSYGRETANPFEYSKFASGKKLDDPIHTKNGMFRFYVPATIVGALISAYQYFLAGKDVFSLAAPLLFVHFFKRSLEVAFVHHYSGTMPRHTGNTIGLMYVFWTMLVALTATPHATIQSKQMFQIGLILFVIGEVGNGYHHFLLRLLRQKRGKSEQRYVPPVGGLFGLVATPHYLFELVAWYGMACVSQQAHAFLTAGVMTSYLAGRAVMTNRWYMDTFSAQEWPRNKKALVPGIF
eukprot:scaffold1719_cov186-Amphora_coffeaeformis.AAC.3